MGNENSALCPTIRRTSGFSPDELSRLEKRFRKLDIDCDGSISIQEIFEAIPKLKDNPLVQRVVEVFDEDQSGGVDFKEFVLGLAQICVGSNRIRRPEKSKDSENKSEDSDDSDESTSDTFDDATSPEFLKKKLEFMFRIYDLDRDGFISNEELFSVLKMMTGDNLTDIQLQQIVNRTILYLDKDSDGQIGLDEFTQVIVDRGTESGIWSILADNSGRI